MISNEIIVSCDLGTSTVKIVVAQMEHDRLNILGVGVAYCDGIKRGLIVDIEKVVKAIRKAVDQAERMVGWKIQNVYIGIDAFNITIQPCEGVVAINGDSREVTDEDKARVRIQAELVQIPHDREIIDLIPLKYKVDEMDDIIDPKGMTGMRLEMRGILVTGLKSIFHNSLKALHSAGISVVGVAFIPFASMELLLSEDERELGTVLIDIGAGTSSVSICKELELIHAFVIPYGGEVITKDLSTVLKTSAEDAERIKLKYGNAFADTNAEEEQILISKVGTDTQQSVSHLLVAEIIESRLSEIFELIYKELHRLNVSTLISSYVITGGVAKMVGVAELAEYIFHNRVRIAVPSMISVREPQYTTSVGVLAYVTKRSELDGIPLRSCVKELPETPDELKQMNFNKTDKQQKEVKDSKIKKFFSNFFG